MSSVHAEILSQLTRYKAGAFVPKDGASTKLVHRGDVRGGFYWGRGEDYCQVADAHVHIEQQAWKAWRAWCKEHNAVSIVSDQSTGYPVQILYGVWSSEAVRIVTRTIADGPTDADALLAMMLFINGETQ